jgi:tetratricopeptide (TPR) repeat protein
MKNKNDNSLMKHEKELAELLQKAETIQPMLRDSNDIMALKFEIGQDYYRDREYDKAKEVFSYLTLVNPYIKKYWHCLAGSQVHLNQDEQALQSYAAAALIDPKDPTPHLCSAYCYLRQGDRAAAESSVTISLRLSQDNSNYKELEQKSFDALVQIKSKRYQ